jgi:hypothetical protein
MMTRKLITFLDKTIDGIHTLRNYLSNLEEGYVAEKPTANETVVDKPVEDVQDFTESESYAQEIDRIARVCWYLDEIEEVINSKAYQEAFCKQRTDTTNDHHIWTHNWVPSWKKGLSLKEQARYTKKLAYSTAEVKKSLAKKATDVAKEAQSTYDQVKTDAKIVGNVKWDHVGLTPPRKLKLNTSVQPAKRKGKKKK